MIDPINEKKPIYFDDMAKLISILHHITNKLPLMFEANFIKKKFMKKAIKAAKYAASTSKTQIKADLTFQLNLNYLFSLINRSIKTVWDFGIGPKIEAKPENLESVEQLKYLKYYYFYNNLIDNLLAYIKKISILFMFYFFLLFINRYIESLVKKIKDLQTYLFQHQFKNRPKTLFQSVIISMINILKITFIIALSIFELIALLLQDMINWLQNKVNSLLYNIYEAFRKLKGLSWVRKYQILIFMLISLGIIHKISEERFIRSLLSFRFPKDPVSMGYFRLFSKE